MWGQKAGILRPHGLPRQIQLIFSGKDIDRSSKKDPYSCIDIIFHRQKIKIDLLIHGIRGGFPHINQNLGLLNDKLGFPG